MFGGPICVTKPNLVPIGRTVAETWPFFIFSPSWILKVEIFNNGPVQRADMLQRAKFCADQSNFCRDMADFRFFMMAAVRHLGFVLRVFGPPTKSICWSLLLADLMTLQVKVPCCDAGPTYDELPIVFAITDEIVQDSDFIIPADVVQLINAGHSSEPPPSLSSNVVTRSQSQALTADSDDYDNRGNDLLSSKPSNTAVDVSTEWQTIVDQVDKSITDLTNADDCASLIAEQKADATLDPYWRLAARGKGGMYVENGVLYHQDEFAGHKVKQLCVPYGRRMEVMRLAHDAVTAGHPEGHKTRERIRLNFFWPNLKHDVTSYISSCPT